MTENKFTKKRAELFCLFCLLLFWRSRCRNHRGILKSLIIASVQKPPLLEKNLSVQALSPIVLFFLREREEGVHWLWKWAHINQREMSSILVLSWQIHWNWRSNKAHLLLLLLFFNRARINKQANCQLACVPGLRGSLDVPSFLDFLEPRFPFSFPFERLPHGLITNRKFLLFCGLPSYGWPIEFLITGCEPYISVNSFFVGFSSIYKRQGDTYHGFYALVPSIRPSWSVKRLKRANKCF